MKLKRAHVWFQPKPDANNLFWFDKVVAEELSLECVDVEDLMLFIDLLFSHLCDNTTKTQVTEKN